MVQLQEEMQTDHEFWCFGSEQYFWKKIFTTFNTHNFILDFAGSLFLDGVKRHSVASLDGVEDWHRFPGLKLATDKFSHFIHSVDLSFQNACSIILINSYTGWNWSKWLFAEWVNGNICKDIHDSLDIVFISPDAGRVQITAFLLIVAQVLMQAFWNICCIRRSDLPFFYSTNFGWKSSSATRCFRALVDCHFNNFVSLTPAETVGIGQLCCKMTIWKALVHFWEIILECLHIIKEVCQIACIVYIVVSAAIRYHLPCTFQKQVPTPSSDSIDCVEQQLDHFHTAFL